MKQIAIKFDKIKFLFLFLFLYGCKDSRIINDMFIVGAYSDSTHQSSIHFIAYYEDSNKLAEMNLEGDTLFPNASFLAFNDSIVFAVQEGNPGFVHIIKYIFTDQNKIILQKIQTVSSFGKDPCFIELAPDHKAFAVANYSSGSFALYNLNENHTIDSVHQQAIFFPGKGKELSRQESSHCHAVQFNPYYKQLFITDLGLDKMFIFNYQSSPFYSIPPKPSDSIVFKPISGPRHFCFSKDNQFLFVVEELSGCLSIFKYINHKWQEIVRQKLYNDPQNSLLKASADIHLSADEKFIYASNRIEENTIAVFQWNKETQQIKWVQKIEVDGLTPRNFLISNDNYHAWVANQNSNQIKLFLRDSTTGKLTPTKVSFDLYKPVFIKSIFQN